MALKREQKAEQITKIEEKVKQSGSLVFVNFHGLGVAAATELRRLLKEQGVDYEVVKKTLLTRALDQVGREFSGEMPPLEGEVALASGEDEFAPAKGVYESQAKLGEGLKIVGGVFGRQYKTAEEMLEIAKIPGRETLYAQLLGLLNWPVAGLVTALGEIAKTKE